MILLPFWTQRAIFTVTCIWFALVFIVGVIRLWRVSWKVATHPLTTALEKARCNHLRVEVSGARLLSLIGLLTAIYAFVSIPGNVPGAFQLTLTFAASAAAVEAAILVPHIVRATVLQMEQIEENRREDASARVADASKEPPLPDNAATDAQSIVSITFALFGKR